MNSGDLYKVWKIEALKRKPKAEEAQKFLETIAKQVEPIMRNHKWRVELLSEFCSKKRLGQNAGAGKHVELRLRRLDRDEDFLPFHTVLDTMLHELCHNDRRNHTASFYKLWNELRKECEDLINKGIGVSGQGFYFPRTRHTYCPLQAALMAATENRTRLGSLLLSELKTKRIGGDSSFMVALSPVRAAVMAAERRLQDNIRRGSKFIDLSGEDECTDSSRKSSDKGSCSEISKTAFDEHVKTVKSRKRSRGSDDVSLVHSANGEQESTFMDLTETVSEKGSMCYLDETSPTKNYRKDLYGEASTSSSISSLDPMHNNVCGTWQCTACTLLNPPLAQICGLCETQKPKDVNPKTVNVLHVGLGDILTGHLFHPKT